MNIDVIMPKMGESITEGTILEWTKKIGDKINQDETLLEISTDKVDSEIPSPSKGILIEILYKVNDVVNVGEVIARISTDDKVKPEIKIPKIPLEEKDKPVKVNKDDISVKKINTSNKRFLSPLVKSIARKEGIDFSELELLEGTGKNNRLNKNDILNYINSKNKIIEQPLPHIPNQDFSKNSLNNNIEKMDRVRLKIGKHMVDSIRTSPHVYSTSEVDMTSIVDIRERNKDNFLKKYDFKLTYTPFILNACIKAIQNFPLINAKIEDENIIHQKNINLGIAVALNNGNLIVPSLKFAEEKNFLGLARNASELAKKARMNQLSPEDVFGSTFTITNPGMFGSLFGMAIINQPNLGILSVGAIKKRPVVKETEYGDVIIIRSMMYLSLGYDHRLIDGAYGTKFLGKICKNLEEFNENEIL